MNELFQRITKKQEELTQQYKSELARGQINKAIRIDTQRKMLHWVMEQQTILNLKMGIDEQENNFSAYNVAEIISDHLGQVFSLTYNNDTGFYNNRDKTEFACSIQDKCFMITVENLGKNNHNILSY